MMTVVIAAAVTLVLGLVLTFVGGPAFLALVALVVLAAIGLLVLAAKANAAIGDYAPPGLDDTELLSPDGADHTAGNG
jgi:hypothetical protein